MCLCLIDSLLCRMMCSHMTNFFYGSLETGVAQLPRWYKSPPTLLYWAVMSYSELKQIFFCVSDFRLCFNFDTNNFKIFAGSKETQFGYTVQQHEAGGHQWWGSHCHIQKPVCAALYWSIKQDWTGLLYSFIYCDLLVQSNGINYFRILGKCSHCLGDS